MTVLVADDRSVIGQGVRESVVGQPWATVVHIVRHGPDVVHLLRTLPVDVLVLCGHFGTLRDLREVGIVLSEQPTLRLLLMAIPDVRREALRLDRTAREGRLTVVPAAATVDEIGHALKTVYDMPAPPCPDGPTVSVDVLTKRERDVLHLLGKGMRSADIAIHLHLSIQTVGTHRKNILRKLGLHSTLDLLRIMLHTDDES